LTADEYFDVTNNRVRVDYTATNTTAAPFSTLKILLRYDTQAAYYLYNNQECYQFLLSGSAEAPCVPANVPSAPIRLGSSLLAEVFTLESNETLRLALEEKTNYPIYELVTSLADDSIISVVEFRNFAPGPQNAALFTPPTSCTNVDASEFLRGIKIMKGFVVPHIPYV